MMDKKNFQDFNKIKKFKNSKIGEIRFEGNLLGALKVISLNTATKQNDTKICLTDRLRVKGFSA